jgi:hypothetical protein
MENRIIHRPTRLLKSGLLALTASTVFALQAAPEARLSSADRITVSPVYWGDEVVGSSTMVRTPNGISFTYDTTGLPAGYVVTLWIVVFNNPGDCFTNPCTDKDIFENPAVQADFLWGAGRVIGGNGVGHFGGHLKMGDTSRSGLAELTGMPTVGLLYPMSAEIQMAIHSHGPAVPGQTLMAQLSSFLGGCSVLLDVVDFPDEVGECVTFESSIHQ